MAAPKRYSARRSQPHLANIYLDRLDKYVETMLIPAQTRGTDSKPQPTLTGC